jgi:hypothetical protein
MSVAARQAPVGQSRALDHTKIIALNRPFAACGKIKLTTMEPMRTARSAPLPLDKSVLLSSAFASPI